MDIYICTKASFSQSFFPFYLKLAFNHSSTKLNFIKLISNCFCSFFFFPFGFLFLNLERFMVETMMSGYLTLIMNIKEDKIIY